MSTSCDDLLLGRGTNVQRCINEVNVRSFTTQLNPNKMTFHFPIWKMEAIMKLHEVYKLYNTTYIYTFIHIYIYTYIHIHIHIYIHIYTHIYIYILRMGTRLQQDICSHVYSPYLFSLPRGHNCRPFGSSIYCRSPEKTVA